MRSILTSLAALLLTSAANTAVAQTPAPALRPPSETTIPGGALGDAIRRGKAILTRTPVYAREFVGARLNCTSCHLDAGRQADAAPWVGLWGLFPAYSARSATLETLEDRVNECFERSMNGKPLPRDGEVMRSILAYIAWLSRGVPTGEAVAGRGFRRIRAPRPPDRARGQEIYLARCAACHRADGDGVVGGDGQVAIPPLWGEHSFNIGAGMARLDTAAAFVRAKMPLGQAGSLTDQDAYDVAAYFTQQPRPDFPAKAGDWPKGDRPADARY